MKVIVYDLSDPEKDPEGEAFEAGGVEAGVDGTLKVLSGSGQTTWGFEPDEWTSFVVEKDS